MPTCTAEREAELDRMAECFHDKYGYECAEELDEETDFTLLGSGDTRYVFETPDGECIVKFSKTVALPNRREVEAWENAPEETKKALTPILDHDEDHDWLVMPKVGNPPYEPKNVREVRDQLKEGGWYCKDVGPGNIGEYQGRMVLYDYGEGCGEHGLGKPY